MKGTAAFQGLKSWASKLHQQLPLSSRESQRLLTALTSSFRQHLDEVHPPTATERARKKANAGAPQLSKSSGATTSHSSAVSADNHLASILTNPLLSKSSEEARGPNQHYSNAKAQLQKQKDPISLLESYHKRGNATVAIAELCLRKFEESTEGLSEQAVKDAIAKSEPGRRILLWLFKSQSQMSPAFVDNTPMIDLLVDYLLKEGQEQKLWDWLQLDITVAGDVPRASGQSQKAIHPYRWKGRVLRGMVVSRLEGANRELKRADDALEVFLKACSIKESAGETDSNRFFPLAPASAYLSRKLTSIPHGYTNTDTRAYDRYIDSVKHHNHGRTEFVRLSEALLRMARPKRKTAKPMLEFFRMMFSDSGFKDARSQARGVPLPLTAPPSSDKQRYWYALMLRTASMLKLEGESDGACWVEELVRKTYPGSERDMHKRVEKLESQENPLQTRSTSDECDASENELYRVPLSTFT